MMLSAGIGVQKSRRACRSYGKVTGECPGPPYGYRTASELPMVLRSSLLDQHDEALGGYFVECMLELVLRPVHSVSCIIFNLYNMIYPTAIVCVYVCI